MEVAKLVGVCRPVLYRCKDLLLGGAAYRSMRKRNAIFPKDARAVLLEEIDPFEKQVHRLQLEHDIMTRAADLIKNARYTRAD